MSYVQTVLQDGEELRHRSNIHWIVYWPGVLVLLCAIVIYGQGWHTNGALWRLTAAAVAIVALLLLFREWFKWWTTEIAVTTRRIIYKTGFISRDTNEMHMDKVESVKVDQSVLGRILDYGDVTVLGTGSGLETMRTIAAPLDLRNHITGI